jgi:hypothetical protein
MELIRELFLLFFIAILFATLYCNAAQVNLEFRDFSVWFMIAISRGKYDTHIKAILPWAHIFGLSFKWDSELLFWIIIALSFLPLVKAVSIFVFYLKSDSSKCSMSTCPNLEYAQITSIVPGKSQLSMGDFTRMSLALLMSVSIRWEDYCNTFI